MKTFELIQTNGVPIKAWVQGVVLDENAAQQLRNTAELPFIHSHVAVMPDVHWGLGSTIGSVIPTVGAIVPAAVGVDLGCGMCAVRTSLSAKDLPDNLGRVRSDIERTVPHGRTSGRRGRKGDRGAWQTPPDDVLEAWSTQLATGFEHVCTTNPKVTKSNNLKHLGTLGTGNHFIELCLDETERVWIMLHSGSRGVGHRIASIYIELAKKDMGDHLGNLPDVDLAYLKEGSQNFDDYISAIGWAQDFARVNRDVMLSRIIRSLQLSNDLPTFTVEAQVVNCHHNYVEREQHFGVECLVTRKGAVRAGEGDMGIIPGSMGTRSFIVRGKGNAESFHSCSHGAGRVMSRMKAKKTYTVEDQIEATRGVECRKDSSVIDEIPMAYKDIEAVMAAQAELVDIVHTLRQVVCVKG